MNSDRVLAIFACMMLISTTVRADDSIKPGKYITEGNWGTLIVSTSTPDTPMEFTIDAWGANGHPCSVEGDIQNNLSVTADKCTIQFQTHPDRISVIVNPEFESACRNYCGTRAWFPGDYFPVDPFCEKTQNVREEFLHNYQSAKFQKARQLLVELLGKCERFTDWYTQAEIRNDLAITQFRLGSKADCLKAIEPIKNIFIDDPANTGVTFTPLDAEWGEKMMKITRFNWKKCGGATPTLFDQ
jgi:hypothetical protein